MDIRNRNPAASKNVEERDRMFKTGKIIIGDKNWPKNQNVVSNLTFGELADCKNLEVKPVKCHPFKRSWQID